MDFNQTSQRLTDAGWTFHINAGFWQRGVSVLIIKDGNWYLDDIQFDHIPDVAFQPEMYATPPADTLPPTPPADISTSKPEHLNIIASVLQAGDWMYADQTVTVIERTTMEEALLIRAAADTDGALEFATAIVNAYGSGKLIWQHEYNPPTVDEAMGLARDAMRREGGDRAIVWSHDYAPPTLDQTLQLVLDALRRDGKSILTTTHTKTVDADPVTASNWGEARHRHNGSNSIIIKYTDAVQKGA